jgi:hypothetical protein
VTYRFLHDRVRQAAYSLVLPHEKPELHLRIGRLMLKKMALPADYANVITMADDELLQLAEREHQLAMTTINDTSDATNSPTDAATGSPLSGGDASAATSASPATPSGVSSSNQPLIEKEGASLMDICAHLNRGQLMVTDPTERWQYAELNCYLAHRTRESTAFAPALTMSLYGMIYMGPPRRLLTRDHHHKRADDLTHIGDAITIPPSPSSSSSSPTGSSFLPTSSSSDLLTPIPLPSDRPSPTSLFTSALVTSSANSTGGDSKDESYSPGDDVSHRSATGATSSSTSHSSGSGNTSDSIDDSDDQLLVAPPSTYDYNKAVPLSVWSNEQKRKVAIRLYSLRLALEYAVGNIAEADAFAPIAQKHASSRPADLARMLVIRCISHIYRTQYPAAINFGIEALAALGVPMPPPDQYLSHALENQKIIKARVGDKDIAQLVASLPPIATNEDRLIGSVMADLSVLGYLTSGPMLAAISTRSVLHSFERGLAAEHSLMYTWYVGGATHTYSLL